MTEAVKCRWVSCDLIRLVQKIASPLDYVTLFQCAHQIGMTNDSTSRHFYDSILLPNKHPKWWCRTYCWLVKMCDYRNVNDFNLMTALEERDFICVLPLSLKSKPPIRLEQFCTESSCNCSMEFQGNHSIFSESPLSSVGCLRNE